MFIFPCDAIAKWSCQKVVKNYIILTFCMEVLLRWRLFLLNGDEWWPGTWPWSWSKLRPPWASCPPCPCMTSRFWPWNQPEKLDIFRQVGFFVPDSYPTDDYSSVTVMTLDLAVDVEQAKIPLSILPTKTLHDLAVLTWESTSDNLTFLTKMKIWPVKKMNKLLSYTFFLFFSYLSKLLRQWRASEQKLDFSLSSRGDFFAVKVSVFLRLRE